MGMKGLGDMIEWSSPSPDVTVKTVLRVLLISFSDLIHDHVCRCLSATHLVN